MATFGEMQDRVKAHVIDVPPATAIEIPTIINDVVRQVQVRHNWRVMESTAELTTSAGTHVLGTVAGFKEIMERPWLRFEDGGNREMEWAPSHSVLVRLFALTDTNAALGRPRYVFLKGVDQNDLAALEVYPFSDGLSAFGGGEYRVNVPYWAYLSPLVDTADTNWFMTNMETYVLYESVARTFAFNLGDQRSTLWFPRAAAELIIARRQDKRSRSARSSVLIPHTDVYGSRERWF